MVIKELLNTNEDGTSLYKFYSDAGYTLMQVETGIEYGEAIDVEGANYTYVETENLVEVEEEPVEEMD